MTTNGNSISDLSVEDIERIEVIRGAQQPLRRGRGRRRDQHRDARQGSAAHHRPAGGSYNTREAAACFRRK
jgi:hypothetical protein